MRRLLILTLVAATLCAGGCAEESVRPNVLVVVLDTLRKDASGLSNDASPEILQAGGHMPNLADMSGRGVTFTNAFANAPWTVPSHASLMTGLLPSGHNCVSLRPRLDPRVPTMAQLAAEAGYATGAFFSNPWLTAKATNVLRGFEVQEQAEITGVYTLESRFGDQGGRQTMGSAGRWLREREDDERPFLMFVNMLETHLSYDPPKAYRERHLADLPADDTVTIWWGHDYNAGLHDHAAVDWSRVARLYAGDAWYADRYLGELLRALEREGHADDTVVIVTSDHGENLGDHGLMEHQYSLHETLLAVPMVVYVPPALREAWDLGVGEGENRDDPVQVSDLFATVLELCGVEGFDAPRSSRSLFAPEPSMDRPVFAEYAGPAPGLLQMMKDRNPAFDPVPFDRALGSVRVGDLRLTVDDRGGGVLHDMATDPGQTVDIAGDHPEAVEALVALLMKAVRPTPDDLEPVTIDEETRRQLESLGYIH